jgi:UDP-glucose 4-epimerase
MSDAVLVTGGAGFIGSHVAGELVRMGRRVVVLDDLSGGFEENIPASCAFVRGSVGDDALVQRLFAEHHFKHVYHLAAYAAEGLSHFIKRFNYGNNVIGSVTLINAAVNHGVECFVFTSSIAVYGHNQLPMTETMVPQPEDSYGIAKYAVELELAASQRMFGLDSIVFRPHNVYGENQNIGDRYRNVIGIFMNQIMRGERLTVFGDGSQTRAFTYVGDVAPAIAASPDRAGARNEVFNIGADRPYTINQLVEVVGAAMGATPEVTHLPARNEVVHAFSDHSKLERCFGKRAGVPLEEGIARMAAWARKHGPRESRPFEGIEIMKNLPGAWRRDR